VTLYIGLMSGTSLDGVDGVLARFGSAPGLRVLSHRHRPFDGALRDELLALNAGGPDELHRSARAGLALSHHYGQIIAELLAQASVAPADVRAVGAHGQTVRHRPDAGYTVQLLDGAALAEACGIDVVCDFRRRDVAAGGQGAPLAPAFHAALFSVADAHRVVLNLGGISNVTVLPAGDGRVVGFDCGPANALLDGWCQRHTGQPYDDDGAWAAGGRVLPTLLAGLLAEPYFALPAPKSTGRDLFNMAWLEQHLSRAAAGLPAQDVQATLADLTVESVARSIEHASPQASSVYVCGGGARNGHVMRRLAARLPRVRVETTDALGVPVDQVEAAAFAWLAHRFVERLPGNLPAVTGARGERLLGALYPA
jgi:anhydro-N-acetylmuramic acid kinase